jgi:uncharacterized zinc-type alcohol dehydrogenase-like protein
MEDTDKIRAWVAYGAGQKLEPYEYDPGILGADEVDIAVEYCGICHSDLSVLKNEWRNSIYPYVPGHEIVGNVVALGTNAKGLKIGQKVGVGWFSGSDMHCSQCISGNHHLCSNTISTIIGHKGGFAERVRAQWQWVLKLPEGLDQSAAGPLMCGGITVFAPFLNNGIKPTDRVGIVGIGGLGHMAIKFAHAWGCDVTAFTHSKSKFEEARKFGADHVVSSQDPEAMRAMAGRLDMLLVTSNVTLDWKSFIAMLAPKGRMHIVGVVLEPIPVAAFSLIGGQRSISGSPTGSPSQIATMLEFAARHGIAPQVEHFPMSKVNEAMAHLESGKARYRIVLDADFA